MSTLIDSLRAIPDISIAVREKHLENSYFWRNDNRHDIDGMFIQHTLKGMAFFENEDGRWQVGPDHAMLFKHGEKSSYGRDPNVHAPYELRWIYIQGGGGIHEIFDQIRSEFGSVVRMAQQGEAGQLVRKLQEDFAHGVRPDRLYLAEAAFRLLIAIYREQVAARSGTEPVAHGRHLLETQFRSPRNLKEWADEIGITREHFTRTFHERYGETPAAFLRKLRLDHAKLLLTNSHMDIDDVSSASGFSSVQTFHRAFRKHFGHPPGQMRQQSLL